MGLQLQLFAYTVAKHYNISLTEVYNITPDIFKQSLVWAMVAEEEKEKEERRQRVSEGESNDVVEFDYSFLESEDF